MTADSSPPPNDDAPRPAADAPIDALLVETQDAMQEAFFTHRLTATQAEELVLKVAELSQAGLPLAAGLYAAAEEMGGGRLQRAFVALAAAIEKGVTLEDILTAKENNFPQHVRGLVLAAVHSGALAEVLLQLIDHQRRIRDQWRAVAAAAAYPMVLILVAVTVFALVNSIAVTPLIELYDEFLFKMPPPNNFMLWLGHLQWRFVGLAGLGVLAALVAARWLLGAARWRRAVCQIPLVGPLWHWMGVSEWARLMSILLRHQLPLPRALQIASHAVRDANMAHVSSVLAQRVEQGQTLQQSMLAGVDVPAAARPFLAWGEKQTQLDQAFETVSEAFEMRTRLRAGLLRRIMPPIVFLMVGLAALFLLTGLLVPIIRLIENLS